MTLLMKVFNRIINKKTEYNNKKNVKLTIKIHLDSRINSAKIERRPMSSAKYINQIKTQINNQIK